MSYLSPYLQPTYIDFPILSHHIMSMAFTVTASAACDSTPGYEHKIVNCTCILVASQSNGTLCPHDSFQEEDLVELCVGLGQVQLGGVLQLSETEALIAFPSTSELMAVIHLLGVATT